MNKDDIIRMAREAGFGNYAYEAASLFERFAILVIANNPPQTFMSYQEGYAAGVAAEREACAKVCEQMPDLEHGWRVNLPSDCAAAIRARGNT